MDDKLSFWYRANKRERKIAKGIEGFDEWMDEIKKIATVPDKYPLHIEIIYINKTSGFHQSFEVKKERKAD